MAHAEAMTLLDMAPLTGIVQRFPVNLVKYPLFQAFPRATYDAGEIKWDIEEGTRELGTITTRSASPTPVGRDGLAQGRATPAHFKESVALTDAEVSILRQPGTNVTDNQARVIQHTMGKIVARFNNRAHRIMVDCLSTGSLSYTTQAGTTMSVSFGLTTLTSPGTKWNDAAADVLTDLNLGISEYTDLVGYEPNVIYYNPKLVRLHLVKNTFVRDWMKRNAVTAETFLSNPAMALSAMTSGIQWIPIAGQEKNSGGSLVERWPVTRITLAYAEGGRVMDCEWASEKLEINNGTGQRVAWTYAPQDGRKGTLEMYVADNGITVPKERNVIRPMVVIAE